MLDLNITLKSEEQRKMLSWFPAFGRLFAALMRSSDCFVSVPAVSRSCSPHSVWFCRTDGPRGSRQLFDPSGAGGCSLGLASGHPTGTQPGAGGCSPGCVGAAGSAVAMGTRGFKGWMLRASSRIALPALKRLVMLSAKRRAGRAVPLCGGTDAQAQWDGQGGAEGCGAQILCLSLLVVPAPITPTAEHRHQLLASRCPLTPSVTVELGPLTGQGWSAKSPGGGKGRKISSPLPTLSCK